MWLYTISYIVCGWSTRRWNFTLKLVTRGGCQNQVPTQYLSTTQSATTRVSLETHQLPLLVVLESLLLLVLGSQFLKLIMEPLLCCLQLRLLLFHLVKKPPIK